MKFNFFSSTALPTALSTVLTRSDADNLGAAAEHAALTTALHALLERLPQSAKGGDYLKRLCDTVLDATPRLRLVWIGFCEGEDEKVVPHAAAGDCVPEAEDWRLPQACFDFPGAYSQAALESVGALDDLNSLFAPWHGRLDACTVNCALAIPLRSEKTSVRGLIVFYADDVDYFSRLGSAPFQAFAHVAETVWQQSTLMHMLTQNAQLDEVTGLMNRRKMSHLLQKGIERARQQNELLSIMLLRIEDFALVNQIHGWNAADALLVSFAREVTLQLRAQDRLGRWTGVEFLYVLPRTDRQHAEFLARGLQAYFSTRPLTINDMPIHLALHIGVATFPQQGKDMDELLAQAIRHLQLPLTPAAPGA